LGIVKRMTNVSDALALQKNGDLQGAFLSFSKILETQPNNQIALYSLAGILDSFGNHAAALDCINKFIALNSSFALAYLARSIIHTHIGSLQDALKDARDAAALDPQNEAIRGQLEAVTRALNPPTEFGNHGPDVQAALSAALQLQNSGRTQEATTAFLSLLGEHPTNYVANYSLGVIYAQSGQPQLAIGFLERAAQANPSLALSFFALGTTYQQMGLFESAIQQFDRALELDPNYLEAYTNKANVLHSVNQHKEALLCLEAALKASPNDTKILNNRGYILTEFKQNLLAAQTFARVLELDSTHEYTLGLKAFAKMHACEWSSYDADLQAIREGLANGERRINPLALAAMSGSAEMAAQCSKVFGNHRFPKAGQSLWNGERYQHRKPRVAFISSDFREHPVGFLSIGLIENLKDFGFETYGISLGINDKSDLYKRYRLGFSHYLDLSDRTAKSIAETIRSLEIDIAIDLSGYTSGSKIDVLSFRPAPVQATYLGFPGSLALPYIDYLIADRVTVPEEQLPFYSERVLYLDRCYLPRDGSGHLELLPKPREDYGLPAEGPVFCSFNHTYKITPRIFDVWCQLLKKYSNGVLWLSESNAEVKAQLHLRATERGVDPTRLIFAQRVPSVSDHLARYKVADVFLDTFPYNGHTTAFDALIAGLPVVTMRETSFASRVASSLLNDLALSNWSVETFEDYFKVADFMVSNSESAKELLVKQKAACNWPATPVLQAKNFAEVLGQAVPITKPQQ
jgi:protein O-GlcNAc transferase